MTINLHKLSRYGRCSGGCYKRRAARSSAHVSGKRNFCLVYRAAVATGAIALYFAAFTGLRICHRSKLD